MWTIIAGKPVRRKLEQIPNPEKEIIKQALLKLENNPEILDIKPMANGNDYRLRDGKWRLIFGINYEDNVIFIRALDSRGDIYKNKNL